VRYPPIFGRIMRGRAAAKSSTYRADCHAFC
jgi:hypothetical protein